MDTSFPDNNLVLSPIMMGHVSEHLIIFVGLQ